MYERQKPLKFPKNPEAYELRLTDDDVEVYTPNREISALDKESPLEDFSSLALVEVKNFTLVSSPKKKSELEIAQEKLEGTDKIALLIHINTPILK